MNDSTPMPFGKHKGQAMCNVPASYLLWLFEKGIPYGELKDYIVANMEVLKQEVENQKWHK